jgi:hypothetical protein
MWADHCEMSKRTASLAAAELRRLCAEMEALRSALSEPEQEPVAYIHETGFLMRNTTATLVAGMKLYAHPPQRKPLTDEEIQDIAKQYALGLTFPYDGPTTPELFARAIERAHGIGGEA